MTDSEGITALMERLQKAKFTGTLELRYSSGEVVAAELHHLLAHAEFQTRPLPVVEAEEFSLKP